MPDNISRRDFFKKSALLSAGLTVGVSLEDKALMAQMAAGPASSTPAESKPPAAPKQDLPKGKIKNLEISRLILGGNLVSGYAHARDLIYVSPLLKHYFTDDKVLETFQVAEEHGINTFNAHPRAVPLMNRYWKERGGKMQMIAQGYVRDPDKYGEMQQSIDMGASAIYILGNVSDKFVAEKRIDELHEALEFIWFNDLPAGIACHSLEVPKALEAAGIHPDFYVKTLHTTNYWSARRPGQDTPVVSNKTDNYFCMEPEETVEFMKQVECPWIAFKVLAAGAIHPNDGFQHAFDSGADFALVGMFDFQIAEDVQIARDVLSKVNRTRPWRG